jgi:hypothetical protein
VFVAEFIKARLRLRGRNCIRSELAPRTAEFAEAGEELSPARSFAEGSHKSTVMLSSRVVVVYLEHDGVARRESRGRRASLSRLQRRSRIQACRDAANMLF